MRNYDYFSSIQNDKDADMYVLFVYKSKAYWSVVI